MLCTLAAIAVGQRWGEVTDITAKTVDNYFFFFVTEIKSDGNGSSHTCASLDCLDSWTTHAIILRGFISLLLKMEWESQTGMYPCSTSSPKVCGCTMYCHGHAAVTGNDWPDTTAGKLSNYLITSDLLLRRSGMLRKWTWTSSHRPPRGERGISNWYLHSTMLHQPSETGC